MDDTKKEVLSEDLMMEILSRLPVKTLLRFRCVCKTWFCLISHNDFANLHLKRSSPGILIKALPERGISSILQLFQMVETGKTLKAEETMSVPETNLPTSLDIELMNSCDGLLCLSEGEFRDVIHVCNPVLCEHITIRVHDYRARMYGNYFALGFSTACNQYKVLRTFYQHAKYSEWRRYPKAEIYTLRTEQWRSIGDAFSVGRLDFNTSLHGCIHWAPYETSFDCICSFDFGSEQFRRLPAPPNCDGNFDGFVRLGVLRDRLCVTVSKWDAPYETDVWAMKEYGKDSWIKQFVIESLIPNNPKLRFCEPLIPFRNGQIFILYNEDLVVCYKNERNQRLMKIKCEDREDMHVIAYKPSFVSLRQIASREEQVLRTNKDLTERLAAARTLVSFLGLTDKDLTKIPKSPMRDSEDQTEKGD